MLDMGNLLWVATFYCLQARFLVSYPVVLGPFGIVGVLALKGLGYYVFRSANLQKDRFKADDPLIRGIPHRTRLLLTCVDLEFIKTEKGSKLLVGGWWGKARHINYLGDWLMAWSWCLPVGFSTPVPYLYVAYFAVSPCGFSV
jgi:Delta14-sterol reductase